MPTDHVGFFWSINLGDRLDVTEGGGACQHKEALAMVSKELRVGILLSGKRHYELAQEAGIHPSTLSKLLNGIDRVRPNDPRILRIAEIVGVHSEQAFVADENQTPKQGVA